MIQILNISTVVCMLQIDFGVKEKIDMIVRKRIAREKCRNTTAKRDTSNLVKTSWLCDCTSSSDKAFCVYLSYQNIF